MYVRLLQGTCYAIGTSSGLVLEFACLSPEQAHELSHLLQESIDQALEFVGVQTHEQGIGENVGKEDIDEIVKQIIKAIF